MLFNRCYALQCYGDNPWSGKRIAIAMSYGGGDPFDSGGVNGLRMFQDIFNFKGGKIVGMVLPLSLVEALLLCRLRGDPGFNHIRLFQALPMKIKHRADHVQGP